MKSQALKNLYLLVALCFFVQLPSNEVRSEWISSIPDTLILSDQYRNDHDGTDELVENSTFEEPVTASKKAETLVVTLLKKLLTLTRVEHLLKNSPIESEINRTNKSIKRIIDEDVSKPSKVGLKHLSIFSSFSIKASIDIE